MEINFNSWLIDKKIRGINVTADLKITEYWKVTEDILQKNELQRRKVKTKGNTYSLLKRDLLQGCIMPPIILAVTESFGEKIKPTIEMIINKEEIDSDAQEVLGELIYRAFDQGEILILDGMQRTFTIGSMISHATTSELELLSKQSLRVEVYIGLSKMGILYRMFTLNTGQTPMSFRHQLEMLYYDYLDNKMLPEGITVLKEIDEARARGLGMYKYQDVIDMFYSYSTGTSQSIDKESLVTKLKEMEFLENYDSDSEDMIKLLEVYHQFVVKINSLSEDWKFIDEQIPRPFGNNITSIFGKVQSMTGFGSACSKLIKLGIYGNLSEIQDKIENISFLEEDYEEGLNSLIIILNEISLYAKKIGNAQRAYFEVAYKELFNPESETYLNLTNCWIHAQEKYNILY
ncbi:hypothetical protein CN544_21880 [Bacillus toyonensis]|uniref:hypothetical protein n=1 Tax=Bacillus toyonensis TaxID=155322 RepID=UPI000BF18672|nr:hypothetical protein [Bacillus toyonensis]PEN79275.1 hypothetical protein CN544_21880 [Bacillus toyonensis]